MAELISTGKWSDNRNSYAHCSDNSCIDYYKNDDGSDISQEQIDNLLKEKYSMFPVEYATPHLSEDKKTFGDPLGTILFRLKLGGIQMELLKKFLNCRAANLIIAVAGSCSFSYLAKSDNALWISTLFIALGNWFLWFEYFSQEEFKKKAFDIAGAILVLIGLLSMISIFATL